MFFYRSHSLIRRFFYFILIMVPLQETIAYEDADGALLRLYDRIKGPGDNVDNIMLAHSLRPHTMEGHMGIYKYVLHHSRNTVAKWFVEVIGIFTSILNECNYCIEHHFAGMTRLLNDDARSEAIRAALESSDWADVFVAKEIAALEYVRKLYPKQVRGP